MTKLSLYFVVLVVLVQIVAEAAAGSRRLRQKHYKGSTSSRKDFTLTRKLTKNNVDSKSKSSEAEAELEAEVCTSVDENGKFGKKHSKKFSKKRQE